MTEQQFMDKCKLYKVNGKTVRDCINDSPDTPYKRMIYWLNKWAAKGIYNYGMCTDLGWFE